MQTVADDQTEWRPFASHFVTKGYAIGEQEGHGALRRCLGAGERVGLSPRFEYVRRKVPIAERSAELQAHESAGRVAGRGL